MKPRILASLLLWTVLELSLGAVCARASLFLDSWGVDYGKWTPGNLVDGQCTYVVEDWRPEDGGEGYLDPGYGGDAFDAEAAYVGTDGTYLYVAVVTGFPVSGRLQNDSWCAPGDVGLDLDGDGAYEFAIDVDQKGALRSGDLTWEPSAVRRSGGPVDPLRVLSWNESASTRFRYSGWEDRYAIEAIIDLKDLGGGSPRICIHWTSGGGNDAIDCASLFTDPVPEPAGLLLLGTGLGLAALLHRLKRAAG